MRLRTPGLWQFLVGLGLLLALMVGLVAASPDDQTVVTRWGTPVKVEVRATEVVAGNEFDLVISADAEDGTQAQVALFGAVNSTLLMEPLADGEATFTISDLHLRHSGVLTIVGQVLENSSEPVNVRVLPRPVVEPVVPLVGPRTIVADGTDFTMVAVSPADDFGNAAPHGAEVETAITRSNGTVERHTDSVQGGIASRIVAATTQTGRVTVSSSVGQVDGPSNVFDQVAGTPATFQLEIDDRNPVADGFNRREVKTTVLRDRFGNVLPDGIVLVFAVESAAGTTFVNSTVQGGVARTRIKAPAAAGTIEVWGRVSGIRSESISLTFEPAVAVVPIETMTADNETVVIVGPVLSALGGYVPDGTIVSVHGAVETDGVPLTTAEMRGGSSTVRLPEAGGPFEVEVLGVRSEVPSPIPGSGS